MSNFPSDPSINTRHAISRRLWTFDGEGWRRGFREYPVPPSPEPAPVPPSDPDWLKVQLLLKMDQVSTPTAFIDSSSAARAVSQFSASPNVASQTGAQFQFGPGSGQFIGAGGLVVPHDASLVVGSQDFTMECWIRITHVGGAVPYGICYKRTAVTIPFFDSLGFAVLSDGTLIGLAGPFLAPANWQVQMVSAAGVVASNTWTHVAFQRSGNRFSLFANGNEILNQTYAGAVNDTNNSLTVGLGGNDGGFPFNGFIDEFRFTIGAARYSWPTYPVPTQPFPTQ